MATQLVCKTDKDGVVTEVSDTLLSEAETPLGQNLMEWICSELSEDRAWVIVYSTTEKDKGGKYILNR